jgi:hypothetical protein
MRNIIDLAAPLVVIGLVLWFAFLLIRFAKKKGGRLMPRLQAACILLLLIELLAFECNVSFKSGIANLLALGIAFLTYCILLIASRGIPQRFMRNAVGFAMFAPIGLALLFSPILLLVTFMLLEDISDSGRDVTALNHNYECRTYDSDGLGSTSYVVRLYMHWKYPPYIEHRVAQKWGDLANITQVSCGDVVTEYVQTHPEIANELRIEDTSAAR